MSGNRYSALELFKCQTPRAHSPPVAAATSLPWWSNPVAIALLACVLSYRLLYPIAWRRRCIYTPSCSAYGVNAIKKYGGVRGLLYTLARIRRCNGSMYRGGHDPA